MTDINALAVVDQQQINNLTIKEVKELWCPLVSDKEFGLFIGICKSFGLNPFKREVYIIKYSASSPASIVVGYEVYLKRADRTGKLDGWNVVIVDSDTDNERAVITIFRKDFKNPFIWECYKKEVAKQQANWKSMPIFMLKKVAIGQGFRLAFPDEMGGLPYVQEEIVQEEHTAKPSFTQHKTTATDITPEPKQEVKEDINAPVCNDEQIATINALVAVSPKSKEVGDWICSAYKVDFFAQLSYDKAEKIIAILEQKQKELKDKMTTEAEAKKEEPKSEEPSVDPSEDQGHKEKPSTPKGDKVMSDKQKSTIEKMLKHYKDKAEGKKALLVVGEGGKSFETLTIGQASNIIKKLGEQIKKDTEARKQDDANNP